MPFLAIAAYLLACLTLYVTPAVAATLPDTLTVTSVDVTGDGVPDTIILNKRSTRGPNFRIWTWTVAGGYVAVTNLPEVKTYRGYVQSDPSLRVNGFVNANGNMSLNVNNGRANTVAMIANATVNLSGPAGTPNIGSGNIDIPFTTTRVSPTAQGFLIPRTNMRKMRQGVELRYPYTTNSTFNGDIALMVAYAEQRINDADMFYARDMGLAWETTEIVIRLDPEPVGFNWHAFWNGTDGITPLLHNDAARFDNDGGGGSGGSIFSATLDFPNDHTSTQGSPLRPDAGGLGHETAHGLGAGHMSSWGDTMYSADSALGAGTVQGMIEEMHRASSVSAPAIIYGAPLAPYAMEDFANTQLNQAVDINVLANDYDGNGDAIHLSYVDAVSDAGGTITNLGGGVVRYTPPAGRLGVDRFHYYVADSGGIENRNGLVKVYTRNTGLANHWLLDETTGSTLADVGPYQTTGVADTDITPIAAGTQPGKIGNAYENLAGGATSVHTRLSFDTGDPLDGDMSVSTWVKFTTLPTSDAPIITKGGGVISGRLGNIRGGWELAVVGGKFYFACKTEPDMSYSNPAAVLQSTSAIATNQWYHLAMVMNRSTKVLRAWINNVEVTNSPTANTTITDGFIENYWPLRMFACGNDSVSLAAVLDDVRIYNNVLTPADVTALYAANDEIPAGAPSPANPSTQVTSLSLLKWVSGRPNRYEFNVYLGTNATAVANATTSSAEYLGHFTANSVSPTLALLTTYYWRVDEVVATSGVVVPGAVWHFTTSTAANGTWTAPAGGSWVNNVNWSGGILADGSNNTADFSTLSLGADVAVTLDAARTIRQMIFDDHSATKHNWTLNTGNAGPLTLAGTNPLITVNSATTTIGAVIAGTQGLAKSGSGTLTLTGTNTYTGSTVLNAGTLNLNAASTFSSGVRMNTTAGSQLNVNGPCTVLGNQTWIIGAASGDNSSTLTLAGTLSIDPSVTVGGLSIVLNATGTDTNSALYLSGGAACDLSKAIISGAGGVHIRANNTVAILGGTNTYSGTTDVRPQADEISKAQFTALANGGSSSSFGAGTGNLVQLNSQGAAIVENVGGGGSTGRPVIQGQSSGTVALTILNNGTGAISFNSTTSIGTYGTLTLGGAFGPNTLAQPMGGTMSLIKSDASVWNLNGTNTNTGSTTITGGTLQVNGSLASGSAVTVQSGGTLGGTGVINGTVTNNGALAPGNSGVGNLTINNALTLTTGSVIAWELSNWQGAAGIGYDKITASSLNLSSATSITIVLTQLASTNFTDTAASFTLVDTTGGITGFAAGKFTINRSAFPSGQGTWAVQLSGNKLLLAYTPTPWQSWRNTYFGSNANNPAISGDFADPDHDGIANLMEYALATNPNAAAPLAVAYDTKSVAGKQYLRLTVNKNPAATDVSYSVEVSSDLIHWNTTETVIESNTTTALVVRDSIAASKRFIRLRITRTL